MQTDRERYILLGTITRAQGIRGEVKVHPYTARPEDFLRYSVFFLSPDGGRTKAPLPQVRVRVQGRSVVLHFPGYTTREEAERSVGWQVWVAAADLPPLAAGEFYLHDLVGKQAATVDGTPLGTVEELIETKGQHLLVMRQHGGELLVPAVGAFLVRIDGDQIILSLPPGLLEINR